MAAAAPALFSDFQGFASLRAQARESENGTLEQVARQFESIFTRMMLKSMREASQGEGIFDSSQSLFFRDLYDQQLALTLSENGGIGLADVIQRQLGGAQENTEAPLTVKSVADYRAQVAALAGRLGSIPVPREKTDSATQAASGVAAADAGSDPKNWNAEEFVQQLWPWAQEAAEQLGLTPVALLAQAALETGWGNHIMRQADGRSANNLFGIKADRRWDGDRVSTGTLEFEQGVAVRKKESFRAYESLRDSFQDYVDFLRSNPRYSQALENSDDVRTFFTELQQAGYATDPAYAEKVVSVLESPEMQRAVERFKPTSGRPL